MAGFLADTIAPWPGTEQAMGQISVGGSVTGWVHFSSDGRDSYFIDLKAGQTIDVALSQLQWVDFNRRAVEGIATMNWYISEFDPAVEEWPNRPARRAEFDPVDFTNGTTVRATFTPEKDARYFFSIEDYQDFKSNAVQYKLTVLPGGEIKVNKQAPDFLLGSVNTPPEIPPEATGPAPSPEELGQLVTDFPRYLWGSHTRKEPYDIVTFKTGRKLGGELDVVTWRADQLNQYAARSDQKDFDFDLARGTKYVAHISAAEALSGPNPKIWGAKLVFTPERRPKPEDVELFIHDIFYQLASANIGVPGVLEEILKAALKAKEAAPGSTVAQLVDFTGEDLAKGFGKWAKSLGKLAVAIDVAGRTERIARASDESPEFAIKTFAVELVDGLLAISLALGGTAAGAGIGGLFGVVGAPIGAFVGGILAPGIYANSYSAELRDYVAEVVDGAFQAIDDNPNLSPDIALKAHFDTNVRAPFKKPDGASNRLNDQVELDFEPFEMDRDWYAAQHPKAEAAVNAGKYGSLFLWHLAHGVDKGFQHRPNAPALKAEDLVLQAGLNTAFGGPMPAILTASFGDYVGDGLSAAESRILTSVNTVRDRSGEAALSADADLSAAANRIVRDWLINQSDDWFETVAENGVGGWAGAMSDGTPFPFTFSYASGDAAILQNARLYTFLSPEGGRKAVMDILRSDGAAWEALTSGQTKSAGIGEYGGLWAVLVSENAAGDAPESGGGKVRRVLGDDPDLVFAGAGRADVSLGGGADLFVGGARRDLAEGGASPDDLRGGAGRDLLQGGRGGDRLDGGAGNDRLEGGAGRDLLAGGKGEDVLAGGKGADRFLFTARDGRDVIRDFKPGQDSVHILDSTTGSGDMRLSEIAAGTLAEFAGTSIIFNGLTPADLSAEDVFVFT